MLASSLTSRADTIWRGRNADFMSGMLDSRSYRALAMLVSVSEGCCRDGLVGAILLRAAIFATLPLPASPLAKIAVLMIVRVRLSLYAKIELSRVAERVASWHEFKADGL